MLTILQDLGVIDLAITFYISSSPLEDMLFIAFYNYCTPEF